MKAVVWLRVVYQHELRFIILLFCRASFVLIYTVGVKEGLQTANYGQVIKYGLV